MAHILVIGASAGIGLATVGRALDKGHAVRAFARQAHRIARHDAKLDKRTGDALSAHDVTAALTGVDAVVLVLGASAYLAPTTLFSRATRILVDAMTVAAATGGTRRLIVVTGLGAGDSRGIGPLAYTHLLFPLVLKRIYDDKDVQEQMIRASTLDWTIVRPGILTNGPATDSYRALPERADWRGGSVSRADVAAYLVRLVETGEMTGRTPLLLGPG